ncbi:MULTISPECIES: hypothetical protein [Terrabacteria group]|uniref:hypothetical protein n=1 Tax=Bacillati TaxID=1783272 RepID=UPI001939E7C1|nr:MULTISPECIES: hypothetical protein [Terrabacteria group]MBW9213112.1 hypothetical protein [Trueperella sp. zg.1013]QRG86935.1 hypothetical protein JOS54_01050 [Bulleidia sp. zg-1006]
MEFIVPKNFKSGRLIMNRFKPIDLTLLISTLIFSFLTSITYVAMVGNLVHVEVIVFLILPSAIVFFLTMPFGINHNLFIFLRIVILYIKKKKEYYWEGIARYEVREDEKETD